MFENHKIVNNNKRTYEAAVKSMDTFWSCVESEFDHAKTILNIFREVQDPEEAITVLRDLQQLMRTFMSHFLLFNQDLEQQARAFERNQQ